MDFVPNQNADAELRAAVANIPTPDLGDPAFVRPKPLSECTVAIVTTAGLYRSDHEQFGGSGDQSYRVLEACDRELHVGHWSPNFDRAGVAADLNVVYPIDRLDELAERGAIGAVAPRHLAFQGAQVDNLEMLRLDTGPAAAKLLRDDGVDVVLLTPICPMCTRTLSAVAHTLEANGLTTVELALVRAHAERMKPPRALYVDFPLGRPLGRPLDADFQHRVIASAFDLLDRESGPVLEDFPETIVDRSDVPLACPIPVTHDPNELPAVAEARGLRLAYERQVAATGRTLVGRAIGPREVPDALRRLQTIVDGGSVADAGLPEDLVATGIDIRSYYEEAAVALSDHVPDARSAETWFVQSTAAGKLLQAARLALKDGGEVPFHVWYALLPATQQPIEIPDLSEIMERERDKR